MRDGATCSHSRPIGASTRRGLRPEPSALILLYLCHPRFSATPSKVSGVAAIVCPYRATDRHKKPHRRYLATPPTPARHTARDHPHSARCRPDPPRIKGRNAQPKTRPTTNPTLLPKSSPPPSPPPSPAHEEVEQVRVVYPLMPCRGRRGNNYTCPRNPVPLLEYRGGHGMPSAQCWCGGRPGPPPRSPDRSPRPTSRSRGRRTVGGRGRTGRTASQSPPANARTRPAKRTRGPTIDGRTNTPPEATPLCQAQAQVRTTLARLPPPSPQPPRLWSACQSLVGSATRGTQARSGRSMRTVHSTYIRRSLRS